MCATVCAQSVCIRTHTHLCVSPSLHGSGVSRNTNALACVSLKCVWVSGRAARPRRRADVRARVCAARMGVYWCLFLAFLLLSVPGPLRPVSFKLVCAVLLGMVLVKAQACASQPPVGARARYLLVCAAVPWATSITRQWY